MGSAQGLIGLMDAFQSFQCLQDLQCHCKDGNWANFLHYCSSKWATGISKFFEIFLSGTSKMLMIPRKQCGEDFKAAIRICNF